MRESLPIKVSAEELAKAAVTNARSKGYIPSMHGDRKGTYTVFCRKPKNLRQWFWYHVLAFFHR